MHTWQVLLSRASGGYLCPRNSPDKHVHRMHVLYKRYVVAYGVQDTYLGMVFENPRTPVDGGGGARMLDVRVSRGRGCLCL